MKERKFGSLLLVVLIMTCVPASMVFAQSIMVEKNLFSPDRKPPSDQPDSNPAAKPLSGLPAKSIQLDGVFLHEGTKTALLRVRRQLLGKIQSQDRDPFPYFTVHEGGSVGDFEVVKIDPSSVTIAKNGQQFVISLFAAGKVVPPAAKLPVSHPPAQKARAKVPKEGQGKPGAAGAVKPAKEKGSQNRRGSGSRGKA